ncbi:MAG: four helix bundle protein [candidate division NC10 bacterium]|nr:four helix bundle protein [candidate division NC10 bacterium]
MFKFEKLDVWKVSLELYRKIAAATKRLSRRDQQFLAEQIMRAALSISANIAEGTGREGIRESKQFFNIAKGSVYEVVSIAHVLRQEGLLHADEFSDAYQLCDRIAGMLSGLITKR